ncbi:glycosyltransferase family 2 protein [Nocardioides panzhihuensis]|uniref:4,4'-diaponeurosporenoate glycosyltransferase n=1 Tax=Nocardioides panzhihuensis TaxID=860243 RepID=A0A7Z0DJ17_9ACTN|nr:glycosyltransferase family 2 protein [Nocardioides panzhihuensis]NYI76314.1 GT2 family glycosyltransferase [Nocardioides panzhihuensis]
MPKPLTTNPALRDVVYKNQWRDAFDGTVPEGWQPTLKVTVVTAAFNSKTLDLTLASLAAQDYPEDLLEVVVIDDGSEPAVTIGKYAPKNTRLIRVNEELGEGWGRSNALRIGIEASDGDIIYWVDSDMILFSDNVREHAKWAHFIPEAATIGHKGFVEEWDFTPEQVFNEVRSGDIRKHHDLSTLHRHWSLDIFEKTDDLNASGGRNYSTHMGACATVTRSVYEQTFGQRPELKLGDDTEIAYQIWQRGAVFIPVMSAETYHLGRATVQDKGREVAHFNDIHFAQRMPIPRYRRGAANRQWQVPFVTAVVNVDEETAEFARRCVDMLLNQTETDLQVLLVGPWSRLVTGRRRVLADPDLELHLLQEWYRCEGRVTMVENDPDDVFPSPYRLDVPVTVGLAPSALHEIMRDVYGNDLGVVNYFAPEGADEATVLTVRPTQAYSRALRYASDKVAPIEAIDAVWGVEWRSSKELGLVDLRTAEPVKKVTRGDSDLAVRELREQLGQERQRVENLKQRARANRERAEAAEARAEALGIKRRVRSKVSRITNRVTRA